MPPNLIPKSMPRERQSCHAGWCSPKCFRGTTNIMINRLRHIVLKSTFSSSYADGGYKTKVDYKTEWHRLLIML